MWTAARSMTLIAILGASAIPTPAAAGFAFIAPPSEGKALVLVFRPPHQARSGWAHLFHEEEHVANFGYRSYLRFEAEPGTHRFTIMSEAANFLDVTVEAGRIYFVEIAPQSGDWKARFRLDGFRPTHPHLRKLERWLQKSNEIVPGARDEQWARRHADRALRRRAYDLERWVTRADRPHLTEGHLPDRR